VTYDVKSRHCGNGMSAHRIWVRSSSEIDADILGYSYHMNGREITVELPGRVTSGFTEYPPVYLPEAARPVVAVVGGRNSDVTVRPMKVSLFQRTFRARKYR
jgi:hypothetical protein